MTEKETMKLALEALEFWDVHGRLHQPTEEAITALKARLAQETALQALHNENERLGLYKDAYADLEQKPVAHLWECLGRWSAYLVTNGTQAKCAPPSWLVDAVKNATTPPQRTEQEPTPEIKYKMIVIDDLHPQGIPVEQWVNQAQRTWVGLTDEEADNFLKAEWGREITPKHFIQAIEAKLKEKNNG